MKKILLAALAALLPQGPLSAGSAFNLERVSVSGIEAAPAPVSAVSAAAPVFQKDAHLSSGFDISVMLPFKAMNLKLASAAGAAMEVIDPTLPVLSRSGDLVVLQNAQFVVGGVEVIPAVKLKPWFEGVNRLAIKVVSIEADVAFGPTKSLPRIDKNEIMAQVFDKITTSVLASMDKAFSAKGMKVRAADVLAFTYDKPSWTLHVAIDPSFIAPLMSNLVNKVSLSHFGLSDEGFTLSMKAGTSVNLASMPGYNLALSDGLLSAFADHYTHGTDFELYPPKREGGISFHSDGGMKVAGKVHAKDLFGKPNIYFSATLKPEVTAANTLVFKITRVDVDKAYGIGVPGFLNNWLQKKLVSTVTDTIVSNGELKKVMTASKQGSDTIKLVLKDKAIMPSFAQTLRVTKMKVGYGVMYLGFEF